MLGLPRFSPSLEVSRLSPSFGFQLQSPELSCAS